MSEGGLLLADSICIMSSTVLIARRTPPDGQQRPAAAGPDENSPFSAPDAASPAWPLQRLLSSKQVPPWYSQRLIRTGYRPVKHSVRFCFQSLAYLHNETVNIYSHLAPAVAALVTTFLVSWYFAARFPDASRGDRLVFEIYLSTCVVCFTISSLYHTLLCHSQPFFDLWVRIDYVAILFQILASFIPGIYLGFYCEPGLRMLYWSMVI